jgi:hypothetical protein
MQYINLTRQALEPAVIHIEDDFFECMTAAVKGQPGAVPRDPLAPEKIIGLQLTSELFLALEEYQARELLDVLHEALRFDDHDDAGEEWKKAD